MYASDTIPMTLTSEFIILLFMTILLPIWSPFLIIWLVFGRIHHFFTRRDEDVEHSKSNPY